MPVEQDKSDDFKELLEKGKQQGFLTIDEINDALPEGIIDPDQVENIYSRFNEMGIVVYETAPDEDLLLVENTATVDEEAAEEAVAALASMDSEFGRTTDPVRMYMREMGSVELLTRQGEIAIAKRIEEGLKLVLTALSQYPEFISNILHQYSLVETGEKRLNDIITGFIDEEMDESQIGEEGAGEISLDSDLTDVEDEGEGEGDIEFVPASVPTNIDEEAENQLAEEAESVDEENSEQDKEAETSEDEFGGKSKTDDEEGESGDSGDSGDIMDSGPDPILARARFEELRSAYDQYLQAASTYGKTDAHAIKAQKGLTDIFIHFKLAPKQFNKFSRRLKEMQEEVQEQERIILKLCVDKAKTPKSSFIKSFVNNETNLDWLGQYSADHSDKATHLKQYEAEILRVQKKLIIIEKENKLSIHDIKEINRRMSSGESRTRLAKKGND